MAATELGLGLLAAEQREAWVAAVCGDRRTLRLDDAPDPLGALAEGGWEAVSRLGGEDLGEEAIAALAGAARAGAVVALVLRDHAVAVADAIGATVVAAQYVVEGAVLADPGAGAVRLGYEPSAWLVAAGASDVPLPDPVWRDGGLEAARLVRANEELARANTRLARERIASYDSAAAAVIGRAEQRAGELEAEVAELRERLAIEIEVAKRNDDYFQATRAKLNEPHHRFAEAVHRRLPGRLRR